MKKILCAFRSAYLCALFLVCASTLQSQLPCYNVVGYFPSWQGAASAIDYSKYSHINYSFGIPNANGTIGAIENSAKLSDLVTRSHNANVKVLLAIGGWLSSSPSNTPFEAISTNASAITQFVNSCANLITQYNLDGIDIDWEYPTSTTRWNALMNPLATRIHSMGKLLTAAVPAGSFYGQHYSNLDILDLVNIMSYDCSCPTVAPYQQAVDAMNYWTGRGVPLTKRVLGVPFYSSDNTTALHVQKSNLAKQTGSGIMIWEISSTGDITAIVNTLGTVCKGGSNPTCPTVNLPATIQAESYCTMSGIQTEACTDAGGGLNVGYLDPGDWFAYKVNVPTTGSYTVQYRVASLSGGGSIRLEALGGGTVYGTLAVPSTGGWQTWTTISHTVQLTAGARDLAIAVPAGGYNLNWISITPIGSSLNLALNKPVTVSSVEEPQFPGNLAVDGNASTRWSSVFSDPQWIYVDLGANYNINRVRITWEAAYATNYTVQGSANASTWNNLRSVTGNTSLVNDNTGLSGTARYIRINGTARATVYGYSIFELEVYGTAAGSLMTAASAPETNGKLGGSGTVLNAEASPNPANDNTVISLSIPDAGYTTVELFNNIGAKVQTIYYGHLEAGVRRVPVSTASLASGIYYYTVVHNGKRIAKKLIIE